MQILYILSPVETGEGGVFNYALSMHKIEKRY